MTSPPNNDDMITLFVDNLMKSTPIPEVFAQFPIILRDYLVACLRKSTQSMSMSSDLDGFINIDLSCVYLPADPIFTSEAVSSCPVSKEYPYMYGDFSFADKLEPTMNDLTVESCAPAEVLNPPVEQQSGFRGLDLDEI